MTKIAIIIGSTRPGRKSEAVARWVYELAKERRDAEFEIIDIKDFDLPLLDEPMLVGLGQYTKPFKRKWSETIASFDGYVFVSPEYNRSASGALKNAIDYLHYEWNNKAAGFVSYGGTGGARAVEYLRQVMCDLMVADVSATVLLSLYTDFENFQTLKPRPHHKTEAQIMLDQVVSWARAMKSLRIKKVAEAA